MTPADYQAMPIAAGDHRIAYGNHPDQFGDLFLPSKRTDGVLHPLVVLVHGGCWRAQFGLEPLGQLARRLADTGIAVWNLEFRRLGGGGGWTSTFTDVAAGADYLCELASTYDLDLSRVTAVGHSAGGHLVLWLAGRHRLSAAAELFSPAPLALHGVVSLAGIADVAQALTEDICRGAPLELMGATPAVQPQRYLEGSPHHLMPLGIPYWQIVGSDDVLVPPDYVRHCHAIAQERGDDCGLTVIDDAGHFEPVDVRSAVWPQVEQRIQALAQG